MKKNIYDTRILFLVNWDVKKCKKKPLNMQSPNYKVDGEQYWFFSNIKNVEANVMGIGHNFISKLEKRLLGFYIFQTIKVVFSLHRYDCVISHGAQSGIFLAFLRRIYKGKFKHILIDVGGFSSSSEKKNLKSKLINFAAKSIDGVIIHESNQILYYKKFMPFLTNKTIFIPYGVEVNFFKRNIVDSQHSDYIVCIGYSKRDWNTLIKGYEKSGIDRKLLLVGKKIKTNNKNILSIGVVSVENMITLIQHSLFCVLPLFDYNYSYGQMTFLQQCILGKPVIVSNSSCIKDYCKEYENCILYETGNSDDLAQKILFLNNKGDLRNILSRNAPLYVEKNFSENQMGNQIYSFVKKILNSK